MQKKEKYSANNKKSLDKREMLWYNTVLVRAKARLSAVQIFNASTVE